MYESLAHFLAVEAKDGCPQCGTSARLLRLKNECDDRVNARLRDTLKPSAEDREQRGYLQQAYDLRAACRVGHDLVKEMRNDG